MELSRRDFLKIFGISAAAPLINATATGTTKDSVWGQTLRPTTAYTAPHTNAPTPIPIWQGSQFQIYREHNGWYDTDHGWLRREDVQPIYPYPAPGPGQPIQLPSPVFVCTGSAVIHAYCDIRAPRRGRVGHGGILMAMDRITYPGTGDWYALGDAHQQLIGWSQAAHWQTAPTPQISPVPVIIDRHQHELRTPNFSTRANLPADLQPGAYHATPEYIGGVTTYQQGTPHLGTPYVFRLPTGHRLHGVYWHNTFGQAASAIEINVWAAARIFRQEGIHLTII